MKPNVTAGAAGIWENIPPRSRGGPVEGFRSRLIARCGLLEHSTAFARWPATNHEGMFDALWRRFDEILYFGRPAHAQLVELMQLRLRSVRKTDVDLDALANEMAGFSYADAERVCLEAIKAMLLKGGKAMTPDLLDQELAEQRNRMALAKAAGQGDLVLRG